MKLDFLYCVGLKWIDFALLLVLKSPGLTDIFLR